MFNHQTLQGHWDTIKGKLREQWGQLTDDELERSKGSSEQLIGLLERRTGEAAAAIERFLGEAVSEGQGLFERGASRAGEYAHAAGDQVLHAYGQATERMRDGYRAARHVVRSRPGESLAAAFCGGLVAGVLVAITLRAR